MEATLRVFCYYLAISFVMLPVVFITGLCFYLVYPYLAWRQKDFKMELVEGFDRGVLH